MKFGNTSLSKRTLALFAATVLLVGTGGYTGTRAALTYFSEDAKAEFELDHLQVHLIENDIDVCHGENDMITVHRQDSGADKNEKYRGNLVEYLGYENDTHTGGEPAYRLGTPGTVEPGRAYKEEIRARNGQNIDQYVRLTIRKYWVKDGEKDTRLSPSLIRLSYQGGDYNKRAWQLNRKENAGSSETETYYLTNMLKAKKDSPLLFDTLTIDGSVADPSHMTESRETTGNKTVITYSYDYDGYTFYIEADVQAIQTHNVNDAISSLWGVENVTASDGVVTVQ